MTFQHSPDNSLLHVDPASDARRLQPGVKGLDELLVLAGVADKCGPVSWRRLHVALKIFNVLIIQSAIAKKSFDGFLSFAAKLDSQGCPDNSVGSTVEGPRCFARCRRAVERSTLQKLVYANSAPSKSVLEKVDQPRF